MNRDQLKALLDEHTSQFINNISKELENSHDQWFEGFGFPIFGVTSKDYHEQVYFQSYLESYARKMINGILKEMCDEDSSDLIKWPELEFFGIYNGYTNSECEKEFGFEFINEDKRTGYRYTFSRDDDADELLKANNVDIIILVEWQAEDDYPCFNYGDQRIKVILLWELFLDLFGELEEEDIRTMYDMFVERITEAIEKANAMISLVTLPGFTPSYLHKARKAIIPQIKDEINALTSFYVKNANYQSTQDNSEQLITKYKVNKYFLDNGLEQALVGTSPYAKSFLTSEYLFQYFANNSLFDYTPIVSGYLKSIEQLLDVICVSHRNSKKINENMSSYTMGNYIYYIKAHADVFRKELQPAQGIIADCLESYKVESRNNLFHKDYFYNWTRVIQIRANTLFLYAVLLGSVNLEYISKGSKGLGLLRADYDRLFEIMERQDGHFCVLLNGKEHSRMSKKIRSRGLEYGLYGTIINTIEFEKFDYDHYETIEISPQNIPSEIWKEDTHGNRTVQIWKA